MTKNTKKNLTWKLKEQPSGHVVAELVTSGVLKPDEAREILFGNSENDKEKIKALEELVKFLEGLVTELSKNRNTTTFVPYNRTVYIDTPTKPYWDKYWMNTHTVLCNAGVDVQSATLTTTSDIHKNADYSGIAGYGGIAKTGNMNLSMTVSPASQKVS